MDLNTLLSQIEQAIEALLTGGHTSYSIGARTVTRLDLSTLMEERRMLLNELQRSGGNSIRLGRIVRPSK
jgi:hypothetical protein